MNLMRSLTARLEDGYYSITVANHRLIIVIKFVTKNYNHSRKKFVNKLCLILWTFKIPFVGQVALQETNRATVVSFLGTLWQKTTGRPCTHPSASARVPTHHRASSCAWPARSFSEDIQASASVASPVILGGCRLLCIFYVCIFEKIFNIWSIKCKLIIKLITDLVCKPRDESNESN